jgi:hypothetical protein
VRTLATRSNHHQPGVQHYTQCYRLARWQYREIAALVHTALQSECGQHSAPDVIFLRQRCPKKHQAALAHTLLESPAIVLRFGMDQIVDSLHNTVHGVESSTFDKTWRVGQGAV